MYDEYTKMVEAAEREAEDNPQAYWCYEGVGASVSPLFHSFSSSQ